MSGQLNHTPGQIIQQLLVDLGHATLPASNGSWPAYYSNLPDSPDTALGVYDVEGVVQGRTHIDGVLQELHGIQIEARSTGIVAAATKIRHIAYSLDTEVLRTTVTIDSSTYQVQSFNRTSVAVIKPKDVSIERRSLTINGLVSLWQLAGTAT